MNGERQESVLWRCFFFSSGYCPIICSIGSRHSSLLATEPLAGYLRHPAALARLSGDFLTQFFYYEGWPDHNGCRAVALGSGGVSFVGSVHGTLGVDSYGVGGGLGGRKAMRIELSAFRHNRFNRYRRYFVVVP